MGLYINGKLVGISLPQQGGGQPINNQDITVTENGTYEAEEGYTGLGEVTVNVPSSSGIGITREVSPYGFYQMPTENFTFSLPSNATDVGDYGLYYAFYGCTSLTSIDLSALTTVSGNNGLAYAFYGCTSLTSIDLSALTIIPGTNGLNNTFQNCSGLTSVDLSSLTTISGSYGLSRTFQNCSGLTSVDLSALTTISGNSALNSAFNGCTRLMNIYFRALTTTSFGSYKTQFINMMLGTGTTVTHTLHFPSNLESTISGLQGYPNFGGTSGYVTCLFDLPATS